MKYTRQYFFQNEDLIEDCECGLLESSQGIIRIKSVLEWIDEIAWPSCARRTNIGSRIDNQDEVDINRSVLLIRIKACGHTRDGKKDFNLEILLIFLNGDAASKLEVKGQLAIATMG